MTSLTVVIPTLNEEDWIEETLEAARLAVGPDAEILVSDGGSADRTRELAASWARVILGPPGRGAQLNAGARAASGQVLLFVHADTRLEAGTGPRLLEAVRREEIVGGCCRFAVHPPSRRGDRWSLLEAAVNLRTRLFRTATGDQAIFSLREAFFAAGGFPEWSLFEDVAFARRLRALGRFVPVSSVARTSRRRWERRGFWRTILLHWSLRIGYWARIPPDRLALWYARKG